MTDQKRKFDLNRHTARLLMKEPFFDLLREKSGSAIHRMLPSFFSPQISGGR